MARWIALDFGKARTGIAVTDDLGLIASPLETVEAAALWDRLVALVEARPCAGFVVGDPGPDADSSVGVADLEAKLRKRWPQLPLHRMDESFTSREAASALVEGGMKKSKRREKGALDKVAAALILQRFLAGNAPEAPDFSALRPAGRRPKR